MPACRYFPPHVANTIAKLRWPWAVGKSVNFVINRETFISESDRMRFNKSWLDLELNIEFSFAVS